MVTKKCECPYCSKNDKGNFYCFRFHDFTDNVNVGMCKKLGYPRLIQMKKVEANLLPMKEKELWVDLHNYGANAYFIDRNGNIADVDPQGWWY